MFCKYCGKEIDNTAKFCGNCGKKIEKEQEERKEQKNEDYKMPISMVLFVFWLVIALLFTAISGGLLFIFLLIPLYVFFQLKNTEYTYNEKGITIKKGLIIKTNSTVPWNKIEQIYLRFGWINLSIYGRIITLSHVKNAKKENERIIQMWNK